MLSTLDSLKPNRPKVKTSFQKRILCIIEGEFELKYIVKIFQLYGYKQDCLKLTEDFIKVAWCDKLPKHINIVHKVKGTCKFDGGGTCKGSPVPTPAIKAFEMYNQDLSIFDSVFVFFDSDLDEEKEVENYFTEKFSSLEINNCLLISTPCFESSLVDFCSCGNCRKQIDAIAEEKEPCDKYKNNFSKLACFSGSKHLVSNLTNKDILDLESKISLLNCANNSIKKFILKQSV
jgi:hypothetical protein